MSKRKDVGLTADEQAEAQQMVAGTWHPADPFTDAEDAAEFLGALTQAEEAERRRVWDEEEARADAPARKHAEKAREIRSIRTKLGNSARGHADRAAQLVVGREGERIGDEEYRSFRGAVSALVEERDLDAKLAKIERRHKDAAKVRVVNEVGPYDTGSPHSWVRDVLASSGQPDMLSLMVGRSGSSDMAPGAVAERLGRLGQDQRRSLLKGDKYGRRLRRILRESRRQVDPILHERLFREDVSRWHTTELRSGLSTGGGTTAAATSGAAPFVPPAFLMAQWAAFRSPYRAWADQLDDSVPLPTYGLELYLPQMTVGTTVSSQTEGSGVSEGVPSATLGTSPIVTKSGQISVDQQYLDRAGPGIAGDVVLFTQIKNQLASQVDAFAIAQALANAQAVTSSGTFALANATAGVGGFLGDLKKAKSKLTDTAGTRLRGTHCFGTSDFVDYVGSYSDGNARPVFAPELDDNRLPIRSQGDVAAEGYAGYVLVGLALFADDNIPLSGSNTQVVVTRADTILLLEGDPIPYCYPPTYAGNLAAVLGVREYVACIPRYPSGVCVISGSAYTASTFA